MPLKRTSYLWRLLLGTLLFQAVTATLVIGLMGGRLETGWAVFGLLALLSSVLFALWLASVAEQARHEAAAETREGFARERERIRLRAEREKTKVIRQSHAQVLRETRRVQAKASAKVWTAFAGVAGLGMVMLFTQLMTVGLLTLTTAGGALGGYLLRTRQDYLSRRREDALPGGEAAGRPALGAPGVRRTGKSDRPAYS